MAFIIVAVAFFSLGVERGKRIATRGAAEVKVTEAKKQPAPVITTVRTEQKPQAERPVTQKEEPAAETKSVTSISAISAGQYTIQVASYLQKDLAEKQAQILKGKGHKAFVNTSGKFYIVYVGEFTSKGSFT
jgi:cell division septation protein DedD